MPRREQWFDDGVAFFIFISNPDRNPFSIYLLNDIVRREEILWTRGEGEKESERRGERVLACVALRSHTSMAFGVSPNCGDSCEANCLSSCGVSSTPIIPDMLTPDRQPPEPNADAKAGLSAPLVEAASVLFAPPPGRARAVAPGGRFLRRLEATPPSVADAADEVDAVLVAVVTAGGCVVGFARGGGMLAGRAALVEVRGRLFGFNTGPGCAAPAAPAAPPPGSNAAPSDCCVPGVRRLCVSDGVSNSE